MSPGSWPTRGDAIQRTHTCLQTREHGRVAYILLMVFFPPILWTMLRLPNLALAVSFLLYLAARSGLCDGILVFQSVLLEISLHIRGMVRAWWIDRGQALDPVASPAVARQRLPAVRLRHDGGGAIF
jgi:hypothetical protein